MKRMHVVILACALALSACASAKLVSGPYDTGKGLRVTLGRSWSDITPIVLQRAPNVSQLTIDGPDLNRLFLAAALAPGQGLLKAVSKDKPPPTFRADMGETELVEFVADSVAALGYQRPETANLRPGDIGAAPGVRFDLSAQATNGLNYAGTGIVARQGERLHVLLYLAPAEHYFSATEDEVDAIFASATLN